jgi:hypothetical protein
MRIAGGRLTLLSGMGAWLDASGGYGLEMTLDRPRQSQRRVLLAV